MQFEPSLQLPTTVDAFTLTDCLGAGAMGEVYKATESVTHREVAIKILGKGLVDNPIAVSRFRQEISAMGHLQHPGIPTFAGYGTLPDGRPYLAMEFVKGRSLDHFVSEQRPVPEDLALWVTERIVDAMGYCQLESGMIHRDLKPGNVMVDLTDQAWLNEESHIRVIDFGLALFIDFGDFDDFSVHERSVSTGGGKAGEVVGTPAYMSPEQIRGEKLTFHSDIYAIGCILYYMLTGKRPYLGSSVGVIMAAHLTAPVPDPAQVVSLRAATTAVVQRAMAKSVAARYRSYDQFKNAIQAARYASEQATRRIARSAGSGTGIHTAVKPTAGIPPPPGQPGTARIQPTAEVQRPLVPITSRLLAQDAGNLSSKPMVPPGTQPSTGGWKRPTTDSHSVAAKPAVPPLPEPPPVQPINPTTSNWRRPRPTPPPAPPVP